MSRRTFGFAQFGAGFAFGHAAAYLVYRHYSSLTARLYVWAIVGSRIPSFMAEFINYLLLRSCHISAPPVASMSLLRYLLRVVTWFVDESDLCSLADSVMNFELPLSSDEAPPSVPSGLPAVVFDVLGVD